MTNQTKNKKEKKILYSDAPLEPSACLVGVKMKTHKQHTQTKKRQSHLTACCDVTETTGLAKRIERQIITIERDHVGLLNY